MKSLDPFTFELWIQGLFINLGADAILSKREGTKGFDHGIDLIVKYKGQKICVQCKKYYQANLVDETILRDLYGTQKHGNFDKSILVTTSKFTTRAIAWASGKNDMMLINGELLQQIQNNYKIIKDFLERA
jgi:restriction endonuclease Mrr